MLDIQSELTGEDTVTKKWGGGGAQGVSSASLMSLESTSDLRSSFSLSFSLASLAFFVVVFDHASKVDCLFAIFFN